MDEDLRQHRIDLAAALRWAARLGMQEGVENHFSLAVPDGDGTIRGDRFLINPYGRFWSEITASSLALCDSAGDVLDVADRVEDTAFFIHSRIHLGAPHAVAVLHTHMPYTTALTLLEDGRLEMCEQTALSFQGRVAYDGDYEGLALDGAEGDRLAKRIGNRSVLFMAGHGIIVTGHTIGEALTDLYYLERAAMFQVLARSTGGALRAIPEVVQERTREQFALTRSAATERHFAAIKRVLEKEEPDHLQ